MVTGSSPHLIEEVYNLEDALVVAGFLNSFIRHADAVKIANLAQVVNVIAPLVTQGNDLLVQSIFHSFRMVSQRRHGVSLRTVVDGPTYPTRRPWRSSRHRCQRHSGRGYSARLRRQSVRRSGSARRDRYRRSIGIDAVGRRTSHRSKAEVRQCVQRSAGGGGRGVHRDSLNGWVSAVRASATLVLGRFLTGYLGTQGLVILDRRSSTCPEGRPLRPCPGDPGLGLGLRGSTHFGV